MKPLFAILSCLLAFSPAWKSVQAQEPVAPVLRMELEKDTAIPGQPIILRVTVLVPTWMSKPPRYPSFEIPNVIVRLPSRASTPTSERIERETWSGIIRSYRLYPMTVGRFEIPAQSIRLTYADPNTREPIVQDIKTQPINFSGKAPDAAKGMKPFIAADALTLEQTISGDPGNLKPGDAFVRTITAHVEGVSPIFLPRMLHSDLQDGLSVYPKEPVVSETVSRGILSGTREEAITYVPEHGGRFKAPPIRLEWFNLTKNEIEVIDLAGLEMAVRGDPRPVPEDEINWLKIIEFLAFAIPALAVLVILSLRCRPKLSAYLERRRTAWHASEAYAFKQAEAALSARDLNAAAKAVTLWRQRITARGLLVDWSPLTGALTGFGRAIYGREPVQKDDADWQSVGKALHNTRSGYLANKKAATGEQALPPLNPGGNV
jgi:hypothetical protein